MLTVVRGMMLDAKQQRIARQSRLRRRWEILPPLVLRERLTEGEDVALAVPEPGSALLALDGGDPVDGPESREVVLLEHDTPPPQVGDLGFDVLDEPTRQR